VIAASNTSVFSRFVEYFVRPLQEMHSFDPTISVEKTTEPL
jgi:hypothetical protein